MRNKFEEQLEQLHVELIRMGALCEDAIWINSTCSCSSCSSNLFLTVCPPQPNRPVM